PEIGLAEAGRVEQAAVLRDRDRGAGDLRLRQTVVHRLRDRVEVAGPERRLEQHREPWRRPGRVTLERRGDPPAQALGVAYALEDGRVDAPADTERSVG